MSGLPLENGLSDMTILELVGLTAETASAADKNIIQQIAKLDPEDRSRAIEEFKGMMVAARLDMGDTLSCFERLQKILNKVSNPTQS